MALFCLALLVYLLAVVKEKKRQNLTIQKRRTLISDNGRKSY